MRKVLLYNFFAQVDLCRSQFYQRRGFTLKAARYDRFLTVLMSDCCS